MEFHKMKVLRFSTRYQLFDSSHAMLKHKKLVIQWNTFSILLTFSIFFPPKQQLFDFWNSSVDSAVQKTGETLNIDLPSRLLKDGKLFELGIWMSPSSPLMWDQHHLAAMALGDLRIGHWKKPHFSNFTIATCQLSTKIQDCRTIMYGDHHGPSPLPGSEREPRTTLLGWPLLHWIKCPASNMSCFQRVFGEFQPRDFRNREIGSVPLPVPLLCESNQDANQGACSACFRCFSVCSCNMIVAVHDSVWHHLTGIALHEASCWTLIQNRK